MAFLKISRVPICRPVASAYASCDLYMRLIVMCKEEVKYTFCQCLKTTCRDPGGEPGCTWKSPVAGGQRLLCLRARGPGCSLPPKPRHGQN